MDIAQVARAANCGEVSGPELVKMFKGQTAATALNILAADNIPPGDRVRFVSDRGLISDANSFKAAVDLAAHVIAVLKDDAIAYKLAEDTITALRKIGDGGMADPVLDKLANDLEDVKGVMLAQRVRAPFLPQLSAIDGILASIYMGAGAALLQAGSCARNTAADKIEYEAISVWQLQYLQRLL